MGRVVTGGVERLVETEQARRCRPWFAVDGDRTLRLDYDLDASSVVYDVGGFEGQWASDVFGRFACEIDVFEPVPALAKALDARFAANARVHVHAFGLAASDRDERIEVAGDRSSTHLSGDRGEVVRLVDAARFIRGQASPRIDLLKVNIEGGEYELLEHLLDEGLMADIGHLQVQFHDFVPDAHERMKAIQDRLRATHDCSWAFEFVWESWARRRPEPTS